MEKNKKRAYPKYASFFNNYLVTLVGCLNLLLVRRHKAVSRLRPILRLRIVHLEQKAALVAREVARLGNLVTGTAYLDHVPRLDRDRSAWVPSGAAGRKKQTRRRCCAVLCHKRKTQYKKVSLQPVSVAF